MNERMQRVQSLLNTLVALFFGGVLVLLLAGKNDKPLRVPYVVEVPVPPTCHETMVPLIDQDGQRVECPYKGQSLEPKLYGDRWFAKCSCFASAAGGAGGTTNF